jgi:hypothetical protein
MGHKTERQRRNRNQQRQKKAVKIAKAITITSAATQGGKVSDWGLAQMELQVAAKCLNTLERLGITVQLAHGAVITDAGYVLAVGDEAEDAKWQVRTRRLTEFASKPLAYDSDD